MDEELLQSLYELLDVLSIERKELILERKDIYFSVNWKRYRKLDKPKYLNNTYAIRERAKIFNSWNRKAYRELNKRIGEIHILEDKLEEYIDQMKEGHPL